MTHFPYHPGNIVLVSICLSFLMSGPVARGDDRSDLLSNVRARHRAARESIRTFSADVTKELTFPTKKPFMRGKYWRSLNMVRVQEYPPNQLRELPSAEQIEDVLLKDSEIRHVGRLRIAKDRYDRCGAARSSSTDITCFCICDAWRYMLIEFIGPSGTRYDYDRFLDLAKSPPSVSRDTLDGHECIRVSMKCAADIGEDWSFTFWHDLKCNCLIRKEVANFGDKNRPYEYEILEFREATPGVFVPLCSRLRQYNNDKLQSEELTTLSNIHVNEAISPDVFVLPPVPAGTILDDRIEGTKYAIDANWKQIGPATPFEPTPLPGRSSSPATEYHAQSQEEPKSIARWVLLASVLTLAVAGVYWFYERRRSRQQQITLTEEG